MPDYRTLTDIVEEGRGLKLPLVRAHEGYLKSTRVVSIIVT